jgi:hypothetical protein
MANRTEATARRPAPSPVAARPVERELELDLDPAD